MSKGSRVALGWLVCLVVACLGVIGFILFMKYTFKSWKDSNVAIKVVKMFVLAALVGVAGVGLWLKDKIAGA